MIKNKLFPLFLVLLLSAFVQDNHSASWLNRTSATKYAMLYSFQQAILSTIIELDNLKTNPFAMKQITPEAIDIIKNIILDKHFISETDFNKASSYIDSFYSKPDHAKFDFSLAVTYAKSILNFNQAQQDSIEKNFFNFDKPLR